MRLFSHIRRGGIIAIRLDEGDRLLSVKKTDAKATILIANSDGLAIRFDESRVRVMGRGARGVRAMKLRDGAKIVGCIICGEEDEEKLMLTVTNNGMGKCTPLSEFRVSGRGGKGIKCQKITEKTGALVGISEVNKEDDLMLITNEGILIRLPAEQISTSGRAAAGVILMRLNAGQEIVGMQVVKYEPDEVEEGGESLLIADDAEEILDLESDESDDEADEE